MKKWIGFILALILIVAAGAGLGIRYFDQPEETGEFQLRIDGKKIDQPDALVRDGELFISMVQLRAVPGLTFFEEGDLLHCFSADRLKQVTIQGNQVFLNHQDMQDLFHIQANGKTYLHIGFLQEELGLSIHWNEKNQGAMVLSNQTGYTEYTVTSSSRLRRDPSNLAEAVEILSPISRVFVVGVPALADEDWVQVATSSGRLGYVKKDQIDWYAAYTATRPSPKSYDQPILLAWDYFNENTALTYKLEPAAGLNILSPTWFSLQKEDGRFSILDMANPEYKAWADQEGYDVWGLFKNAFEPDWTKAVVRDPNLRHQIQLEMMDLAKRYGLDGINIDFENVYEEDRDYLSQFIREFYILTREADLYLSMDVTRPGGSPNWSLCYDRQELIKSLDYMILMAYDEYFANGGVSGPVASMPWTEESIQMMLEEVPADQLVLGIPLYVRRWKESLEGTGKATSKALTLNGMTSVVEERELTPVWDADARQFKVSYETEDGYYQIWLEDEVSMYQRIALIHEYELAGFGAWRKGFEEETTWHTLYGYLTSGK